MMIQKKNRGGKLLFFIINISDFSGGSRPNVDRVLSQKNLAKNEIFVHFHSNLEILTRFQKICDLVWTTTGFSATIAWFLFGHNTIIELCDRYSRQLIC